MEDILATQNQLMGAMDQLITNFKKDSAERKTHIYIKKRVATLDSYWQEFQANHVKLCDYQERNHQYFIENVYQKTFQYHQEKREMLLGYVASSGNPEETGTSKPFQHGEIPKPLPKNNSKLDDMLRKQKSNFKAFTRTISNIDLDALADKWEFDDILKTIHERWTIIDHLHWEIDSELSEENPDYESTFSRYEEDYNAIKKEINRKMWSVSHRERSTPQMDIPTFSGNYHQWMSFKDLFNETIHSNRSMSNAQKMQFLKNKLRGEAEKLIQHLNISSDNYQVCWEILNHRYNNIKLIFTSHINNLLSLPAMPQQSAASIKRIHDMTNECLNAIKNLGVNISTWDPIVVHLLSQKLDTETHSDYIESLKRPRELPVLKEFLEYLENKFTSLESSRRKQDSPKSSQHPESIKKPTYKAFSINKNEVNNTSNFKQTSKMRSGSIKRCPVCENQHLLFHCDKFLESNGYNKQQYITKLNLCKNCLYNHNGKECYSEKTCRVCNEKHNTLVHDAYSAITPSAGKPPAPELGQPKNVTHVSNENITENLLATAQINIQKEDGSFLKMRALIDQGSQTSLITENAAQLLGLRRQRCKGVIFGLGAKENNCKGVLKINVRALNSDYTFTTEALIMKNLINNLPNQTFPKPSWEYLQNIQLADPEFNVSRPVDLLLGVDVYSNIIQGGIIRESESQPIAQQTRLGWLLCGNFKSYQCNVVLNNVEDIQRFWSIEDIAENSNMSSEDLNCIQHYKTTTSRRADGKYVVKIPLKSDAEEKLGASKPAAVAQFLQLEKKLLKNINIAKEYKSFIHEYIHLGHMSECVSNTNSGCYLPHHCVRRAESTTTALRVVFNASAKTSSGQSLNDLMYSGPNLQQDLLSLILKWRQHEIVLTADVEKMFRQIWTHEDHQKYQKIIWRDDPNERLREYALSTVTYGTKSAPVLAMMTLKQLADDERYQLPEAASVLENNFYMDDLLCGSHSISSAKQIQADLIKLLKLGGFNLRKWTSNRPELLVNVDTARNIEQAFDFKHQESTKTLELRWHPHNDQFTFQLKIISTTSLSSKTTKRTLLSDISKIFDPHIDSTVILSGLQGEPSNWKPIVANQVQKTTEIMPAQSWRYVSIKENPADCASRGTSTEELLSHPLRQGSDWLSSDQYHQKTEKSNYTTNEEVKKPKQTCVATQHCNMIADIINKHSSCARATRVLAWIVQFTLRNRNKTPYLTIPDDRQSKTSCTAMEKPNICSGSRIQSLKRVKSNMDQQQKMFNQHINILERATNVLSKRLQDEVYMNERTLSSIIANNILSNLKNIQDTLLDIITNVYQGKFNSHLLTPAQLREELNIISGHLSKDIALPCENINMDLTKVYHWLKVKTNMAKDYLIFEIKIPLVSRDNFELYKVIPIPKKIDNHLISIAPAAELVSINIQKDAFLPMTETDLERCCPLKGPIHQMKSDQSLCITDLKTNQCKTSLVTWQNTMTWTKLNNVNSYLFICCGTCTARIICGHQVTAETLSQAGVINIVNSCVIKDEAFTMFTHKQQVNELDIQAGALQFDIPAINNVVNLSIPVNYIELSQKQNQKYLTDIKQQINQMKAETPMADKIDLHDVHHYSAIYTIIGVAIIMFVRKR